MSDDMFKNENDNMEKFFIAMFIICTVVLLTITIVGALCMLRFAGFI